MNNTLKHRLLTLFLVALMILGMGIWLYPIVSNYISRNGQARAIQQFHESLAIADQEELDRQWKLAEDYNYALNGTMVRDPFIPNSGMTIPENYEEVLNVDENGVMGTLEIPKIDVSLPIYHGVEEDILNNGVGHLQETALPIGGEGNHTVLAGHRGLPEAILLTDLDKMVKGDVFYIEVLNHTLAYQVSYIKTIDPNETDALVPQEGKDYVTLLTCTPYGINSHRLLVRGERIPYDDSEAKEALQKEQDDKRGNVAYVLKVYGAVLIPIGLLLIFLLYRRRKKRRGEQN